MVTDVQCSQILPGKQAEFVECKPASLFLETTSLVNIMRTASLWLQNLLSGHLFKSSYYCSSKLKILFFLMEKSYFRNVTKERFEDQVLTHIQINFQCFNNTNTYIVRKTCQYPPAPYSAYLLAQITNPVISFGPSLRGANFLSFFNVLRIEPRTFTLSCIPSLSFYFCDKILLNCPDRA